MTSGRIETTKGISRFTATALFAAAAGIFLAPQYSDAAPLLTTTKESNVDAVSVGSSPVKPAATRAGTDAIEIGTGANAYGFQSIAIGWLARSYDSYGVALGSSARAYGLSTALGRNTRTENTGALAVGASARAIGFGSVSLGEGAETVNHSIALGAYSSANYLSSIAIGFQMDTTEDYQILLGNHYNNTDVPGTMAIWGDHLNVGAASPSERFDLNGRMKLWNTTHPTDLPTSGVVFYAVDGMPYLATPTGSVTRSSYDFDPAQVDPKARSSFSDLSVKVPISINQSNAYLGKGTVVDLTKALSWVERQMQREMGREAGKVFYDYDLPNASHRSAADFQVNAMADAVMADLDANPWTEVEMVGNRIPDNAWERAEVTEWVEVEKTVTDYKVNWETNEVVPVQRTVVEPQLVGTGEFHKQLKDNYKLEDGKLYRQRTADDVDFSRLDVPELPSWVGKRVATK